MHNQKNVTEETKGIWLGSIGHGYNDMFFFLFPLLLPFFRSEFSLTYVQGGLIISVFMATIAVFSLVSGSFGDRVGHCRALSLGFVVASTGLIAVTFAPGYGSLLALVLLSAIGVSTFHPLATALISFAKKGRVGLSMGVFEACGVSGGLLATLMMSLVILSLGWRWTIILFAAPGFVLAHRFWNVTSAETSTATVQPERIISQLHLALFFAARTIRGFGAGTLMAFLPLFITDVWQLPAHTSSLVYSTFFVGGIGGGLLFGYLAESRDLLMLTALSVGLPAMILLVLTAGIPMALGVCCLVGLGFCFIGFFPPHNCWVSQVTPSSNRGRLFGIGMTLETTALAIAPSIFGLIADRWGLIEAFRWLALPWLGSTAMFIYLMVVLNRFTLDGVSKTRYAS